MSSTYVEPKILTLKNGPYSQEVDVQGYGFIVVSNDDPTATIQMDTDNSKSYLVSNIMEYRQPDPFSRLYVTNYDTSLTSKITSPKIKLMIIKDTRAMFTMLQGYQMLYDLIEKMKIDILQSSASTTRYEIWSVDASLSTTTSYNDPNQTYFKTIPLIKSITPLVLTASATFNLHTTAISNITNLTPVQQDGISSDYLTVGKELSVMGFSVIYEPVATAVGTSKFLLKIQQPITDQQYLLDS